MCDRDCFHCPFPDCIEDGMTLEDYRESAKLDRSLYLQGRSEQERKLAAKKKAYYEANREELAAKQKAYYEANREEIAAKKKAYYEANREEIAAKQKAYREANREEIAAYQKAYREANREEIAAKKKAYYEANREELAAKQKAYYEANREEIAAMGRVLQRCRKATGLSQARLGECLGVSRQQVCHFEAGRQRIAPEKYLAALSELSGMSVDSLLQEEETIYESLQSYR